MNVVNVVLTEQYGKHVYTSHMKSAVSAAAIIGAVIGQLLFGFLGDVFGRKVNMIITCCLLIFGGILCTVAYAGDATNTLWFLVIGSGCPRPVLEQFVWRPALRLGVIPACVVCYTASRQRSTEAYKAVQERGQATVVKPAQKRAQFLFILKNYGLGLLGTAGTWFLFDIVFYAQNLFSASILSVVGVKNASLQQVTTQNAFVALMALPGYYVAIYFINRLGRKVIQLQGFTVMTIIFLMLAIFWDDLKKHSVPFIILYGLALFFSNFGPNTSTFVMPTEMFPTPIRSTCHGFSAACGKAGAAIGSFGFSIWVDTSFGYDGAFYTFAIISFISIPLTWFCTWNDDRASEEIDAEFYEKLNGADEFTRESFASVSKSKYLENHTAGVYKNIESPQT
ncbi:Inorganic phosphate transporter, partial [Globisporangium splendens]